MDLLGFVERLTLRCFGIDGEQNGVCVLERVGNVVGFLTEM